MAGKLRPLSVCLIISGVAHLAMGEDFRIESKVTVGENTVAQNLTLFSGGRVFDFLTMPNEITVFDPDPRQARFMLIDPRRQVRTEVPLAEVQTFMQRLQEQARKSDEPFLQFLADPKFTNEFDKTTGFLRMSSPFMVYQLNTAKAPNAAVVKQYNEFSNWYAMLNTMTTVGRIPPFARMAVNAQLKQLERVPLDVKLVLHLKDPVEIRSDHKVHWKLLNTDLQKIRTVDEYLAQFKQVSVQDYYQYQAETTANREDPNRK